MVHGSKDQPGRDGHEESVVATHSCSVQFEMFNQANAKKSCEYLARYSPTPRRAGINFLPSLVPCTGSEKSVSLDILTFLKNRDHVNVSAEHLC